MTFCHIKQPFQLHSQSSHNSSSRFVVVVVDRAVVVVELWMVVVEVVEVFVSPVETVVVGFGVGPVAK